MTARDKKNTWLQSEKVRKKDIAKAFDSLKSLKILQTGQNFLFWLTPKSTQNFWVWLCNFVKEDMANIRTSVSTVQVKLQLWKGLEVPCLQLAKRCKYWLPRTMVITSKSGLLQRSLNSQTRSPSFGLLDIISVERYWKSSVLFLPSRKNPYHELIIHLMLSAAHLFFFLFWWLLLNSFARTCRRPHLQYFPR